MANGCERFEKFCFEGGCPVKVHEEAIVTVPCAVRARSEVGEVIIKCTGEPTIIRNSCKTPGRPDAVSRFTVSQRLRVDIPIFFSAEADVGEGHVLFESETEDARIPILPLNQPSNRDCFC